MGADVRAYWHGQLERAEEHAAACKWTETPVELGNPCATYATLEVESLDARLLHARVIRPADTAKCPVVFMFHDASRGVRGWHHMTRFVACGFAVVALENREGVQGVLVPEPLAVGDGLGIAMRVTGEEPPRTGRTLSRETAEAVDATLRDALVLARLLPRFDGIDASHVLTWGEGFGGGLALAVASLIGARAACALNPLPLSLAEDSAELDMARIAQGLDCPVLLGTCGLDLQTPSEAQDALAATFANVRHIHYPRYGHERVNVFEDEMLAFLVSLGVDQL